MSKGKKAVKVIFDSIKLKKIYESLDYDNILRKRIDRAIEKIKNNPHSGEPIPRRLVPKDYNNKGSVFYLKLGKEWRLIYSLTGFNEVEILAIVLDWFDSHKDYEKKFKYKVR